MARRQSPAQFKEIRLKRQLSLWNGVGMIVGATIGSGIFVSPTGVLKYSGSIGLSLLVWLFTGLMGGVGAICMVELGTMLPKSGGLYIYILESYGALPAFLCLWTKNLIIRPFAYAILALTCANYLIQPLFPHCDLLPHVAVRLLAAIFIGFITWLHCFNTTWAVRLQDALSCTKVLALVLIGAIGGYFLLAGSTENYQDPFSGSNWSFISIATAYYHGYYALAGWANLNNVIEEMKNPIRDLPRAVAISITLNTVIYLMANAAYFVLLTPVEMLSSNAVAVSFGNNVYDGMGWVMSILVTCSSFGALGALLMSSSRVVFSGAREGQLPKCLAVINAKRLTPMVSILFCGGSSILILVDTDIISLITYLSFASNIFLWLSITSVLWLRYKRPELERPIKIWLGFPIIYSVFGLMQLGLSIFENPLGLGVTLGVVLAGVPFYIFFVKKKNRNAIKFSNKLTRFLQILTLSLPEEKHQ